MKRVLVLNGGDLDDDNHMTMISYVAYHANAKEGERLPLE